jgi:anti-anti-sigma factor
VEVQDNDRTGRVTFSGDLDVYRRSEVEGALPAPGTVDHLVIDMRGARALDSTIIAVIMRYRRKFVELGGDPHNIVIVVPPPLRRIFEITGLVSLLTIVSADPLAET